MNWLPKNWTSALIGALTVGISISVVVFVYALPDGWHDTLLKNATLGHLATLMLLHAVLTRR